MYSLDGQPSWNYFKNIFSNHIGEPTTAFLKAGAAKFKTATPIVTMVGLSDMATYG
jgi:hypothetical protein